MSLHERAWSGINIIIFGSSPTVPMRIEQSISDADPSNEILVESFERYDDAYAYCKEKRSVGLIILLENCGGPAPLEVFQQLAAPFEEHRGPCFGILVHENQESIAGHATLRFSKGRVLDYISLESFQTPAAARLQISKAWTQYIVGFESTLVPEEIRSAIQEIVEPIFPSADRVFIERCCNILFPKLAISWLEALAIKWAPIAAALESTNPTFARTQKALLTVCATARPDPGLTSISEIARSNAALVVRLSSFIFLLRNAKMHSELESLIQEVRSYTRPGAPGLIRQIDRVATNILKFSLDRGEPQKGKVAA